MPTLYYLLPSTIMLNSGVDFRFFLRGLLYALVLFYICLYSCPHSLVLSLSPLPLSLSTLFILIIIFLSYFQVFENFFQNVQNCGLFFVSLLFPQGRQQYAIKLILKVNKRSKIEPNRFSPCIDPISNLSLISHEESFLPWFARNTDNFPRVNNALQH